MNQTFHLGSPLATAGEVTAVSLVEPGVPGGIIVKTTQETTTVTAIASAVEKP